VRWKIGRNAARLDRQMRLPCIFAALFFLASVVRADSITTIELQNRPAAEVIPIIQPMLGPGDALSGESFTLFLKSSPDTATRIRGMIAALDVPARVLQISVFQGSTRSLGELGIEGNLQLDSGNVNVDVGSGGDRVDEPGGSVTYGTDGASGSIGGIRTRSSLRDNPVHQVRVTEGTEAYIETGQQIPYFSGWVGRKGAVGGVDYKAVTSGFYVLPRIRGDNVALQVSPFRNAPSDTGGGIVDTQSASTTITGRIGAWILIGGVTGQVNRSDSSIGSRSSTQSASSSGTWIRADLVE